MIVLHFSGKIRGQRGQSEENKRMFQCDGGQKKEKKRERGLHFYINYII
jgi:hypothetical protein